MRRVVTSLITLGSLTLPFVARAQTSVVQCKPFADSSKLVNCDLCELLKMGNTIISIAAGALVGISVMMLVVGGLHYITSAGNENLIQAAKKIITYSIAGLVVVTLAFVIIKTVATILQYTKDPFSGIQCVLPEPAAPPPTTTPPEEPPTTGPPEEPPPGGADCEGTVGGCKNSPSLTQFTTCFENQLSGLVPLGTNNKNTYGDGHRQNSCHYGGRSCTDGSHAVDYPGRPGTGNGKGSFTDEEAVLINSAINICGSQVGGAVGRGEDNAGNILGGPSNGMGNDAATHIHINVNNGACGCN